MLRSLIQAISWFTTARTLLFTSSYELESDAIDALRSKFSLPILPIGPFVNPRTALDPEPTDHHHYKWLDSQPNNSVLYVSFGSYLSTSAEQMDEIAMGLRISGVRFLWVAREESSRIEELTAGLARLVVPWCDQFRVLCHSSVGGFLTHCGWNSVLESVLASVPILTFPLMLDQHPNSKLVLDDWRVGMRLKDEEEEGVVGREKIANVVRKLMDLDESKEMRRRVGELKEMCGKALEEKGSSSTNLDAFVKDLVGIKENGTVIL